MSSGSALIPLDRALARLLDGPGPVVAETVAVPEALGLVAAETLRAPRPLPVRALALRRGIAVASADLVGATPHAPALLPSAPPVVFGGDELPEGADAVLPADAAAMSGPFHEIGQSAYPGEGAVLPGTDLADGAVIVSEGARMTAEVVLALQLAGITSASVLRPRIAVTGDAAGQEAAWLRARLAGVGCAITDAAPADLILRLARDPAMVVPGPGLALQPGGDVALLVDGPSRTLVLAPRADALAAALFALILPVVAVLQGRRLATVSCPLTRKIAAQVGLADLALLRHTPEGFEPLGVGRVTLAALLAADAVAILGPGSEGAAAGTPIAAIPLQEPFDPR